MKMFAVNKELLPFKLHYLFIAAVRGVVRFSPPLARQKGIPPDVVGVMWAVFPIFNIIAMMITTNLADRFNLHRGFFFTGIIMCLAALAGLGFGPDIKKDEAIQLKYLNTSCQNGNVFSISHRDKIDWFHCEGDLNTSQTNSSSFNCSINQDINSELNAEIQTHIKNSVYNVSADSINAHGVIDGIHLINQSERLLCQENYTVTCVNKCSPSENGLKLMNSPMIEIIKNLSFWLLLISLLMFECWFAVIGSFFINATFQILGDESHKFGAQRVWATIGFGIMILVYGAAIDYFSEDGGQKRNYSAGYVIAMILWVFAFISAVPVKFVNKKEKENEAGSVLDVLNSLRVQMFMGCVLFIGMCVGFTWTFQFLLIEDVANDWEPGFANLNLLQGLALSLGCFAGEVPTMYLSGAIIKYLGNVHTFTLVLAILSIRFIIFAFIKNPWFFLPVEILFGIAYGLSTPNYVAYADSIAPPGRYATMQGLVISIVSIGTSLGALIGGAGFKLFGGPQMFLYTGLAAAFFMVIYVISNMLLDMKKSDSDDNVKEDQDCQTNPAYIE